jgi:hypothetical protein
MGSSPDKFCDGLTDVQADYVKLNYGTKYGPPKNNFLSFIIIVLVREKRVSVAKSTLKH